MLKFFGSGSAFNVDLGNNNAYFKTGTTLTMIDCGSSNFERIVRSGVLDNIESVNVIITHTHPDHIGSLGDLIFYTYFKMKIKTNVCCVQDWVVKGILDLTGVASNFYELIKVDELESFTIDNNVSIEFFETSHAPELDSFGLIINLNNNKYYYSGDSNKISESIIGKLKNGEFDYFYQDTTSLDYEGNVHLSFRELCELIPLEHRHKVWCMHMDNAFDIAYAEKLGFNVTRNIFE